MTQHKGAINGAKMLNTPSSTALQRLVVAQVSRAASVSAVGRTVILVAAPPPHSWLHHSPPGQCFTWGSTTRHGICFQKFIHFVLGLHNNNNNSNDDDDDDSRHYCGLDLYTRLRISTSQSQGLSSQSHRQTRKRYALQHAFGWHNRKCRYYIEHSHDSRLIGGITVIGSSTWSGRWVSYHSQFLPLKFRGDFPSRQLKFLASFAEATNLPHAFRNRIQKINKSANYLVKRILTLWH